MASWGLHINSVAVISLLKCSHLGLALVGCWCYKFIVVLVWVG